MRLTDQGHVTAPAELLILLWPSTSTQECRRLVVQLRLATQLALRDLVFNYRVTEGARHHRGSSPE